jgi:mono/diheme cytochrome c family protein
MSYRSRADRSFELNSLFSYAFFAMLALTASEIINAQQSADVPPAAPQRVEAGRALYDSVGCWACHGYGGQGAVSGGMAAGPKLAPNVYPKGAFFSQLRQPRSQMPPYGPAVLSDAQIEEIYDYLRSLPPTSPAADIPLLSSQ